MVPLCLAAEAWGEGAELRFGFHLAQLCSGLWNSAAYVVRLNQGHTQTRRRRNILLPFALPGCNFPGKGGLVEIYREWVFHGSIASCWGLPSLGSFLLLSVLDCVASGNKLPSLGIGVPRRNSDCEAPLLLPTLIPRLHCTREVFLPEVTPTGKERS